MSKSLSGYTTIDKSLSGIITISDGGGTTISEGNITCNSITVTGGGGSGIVADNFNATTLNPSDTTYYRVVLTDDRDNDGTPYPFYTDTWIQYVPENTVLYCAAWQVWCKVESQVPVASNEYSLYFGNNIITESVNDIYKSSNVTYQPANQRLSVKNIVISNSINSTTAINFNNNMTRTPLIYDSLGGNGTSGLPIWSNAYNQIIFPTNLRTYGNWVVDKASYFSEAGNVFNKNLYVNDANFNKKNFLQLCIQGDGSLSGYNNVVGIDFTSWSGRTNASCRIYAQDNQDYSSDLVFVTAPSGGVSTTPTKRMTILANGNIGIGTASPTFNLEIAGETKTTALTVGNINASSVTNPSYVYCEKTSGNVVICNNASFTGNIKIGNDTNLTGNVSLYGADCNLYGSNWKAVTQATADSSTKIATTAFVKNNISALDTTYIKTSATGDQTMNSNLLVNGYFLQSSIESITVGGGASNQYVDVVCSEDGMRVYTFASGGKTVYGSYNGGKTWAGLYTNPGTTTINNICCNASGRYIFVSFASLVCQYSANGGNSWQALTITGLTTYFPKTYVSCSYDNVNTTLQIAVTNNNTTTGRVEIYPAATGVSSFVSGAYITGSTAQNITHCFTQATTSPNLLISTGAGQTVYACTGLMTTPLTSSDIVFSGTTITGKIRSNYGGDFAMLPTTANLYQSQVAGLSNWTSSVVTGSYSSHCNKEGNIFVYAAGSNLWLSNNQYTQKIASGSSVPFYELVYNSIGNQIKDAYVSASGNRVYFVVTGSTALDQIFYFDLKRTSSVYNSDFVVNKDNQVVKASLPQEPLGSTPLDILFRDKTCYIGSSCTIAIPFYSYYALTGGTGFTLTLPKITDYMLNIMTVWFHTGTKTVTFNCNAIDAIVPPAATIVTTATTYNFVPTATNNRIHLMPILSQNVQKSYMWMVLI